MLTSYSPALFQLSYAELAVIWKLCVSVSFHERRSYTPSYLERATSFKMPPQLRINAVAFISSQNAPILIHTYGNQQELKYQYIAHTSLDIFEERCKLVSLTVAPFLLKRDVMQQMPTPSQSIAI